ncbi:MAG TPA: protein kinase, partial [Aquihabitans sp.]|nr:protein kinase [Aquihabitans sp.]
MAPSPSTSPGSPADGLTGRVLGGRYRLNHPIASGGMAEVWEATDQVLARRVAVKILHPHLARDESFVRRFRGEAIAAARLAHPSIVSVYDTLAEDGINAIVMELVNGTTMRADLDQHGPLQLAAVLAIGTQVADALGAAHASGLVHRDVKPANILLSSDGRVLVADFGIAKAAEAADLTSDGSMVGTAKYLAPEQVEGGPVDGRTDLYALGVVLYEALTGQPPFTADTDTGTALARLHRDPTPPRQLRPEIPPSVEQVVTRAMARRPDDRFRDAAEMRRALLGAGADPAKAPAAAQAAVAASGEHAPVRRPPLGPPGHVPHPPTGPAPASAAPAGTVAFEPVRRRGPWVLALLGLLLLGGAGAAVALTDGDDGGGGGGG